MRSTSSLILLVVAACGRSGAYDVMVRRGGGAIVQDWTDIAGSASGGGVSHHSNAALCDRVAIDTQGRIYVAWADASSGAGQVYLRRFDGAWTSLADSGDGPGLSLTGGVSLDNTMTCPGAIAFGPSDVPYVAWQHCTGTAQPIYVRYWDNSAWRELGGSGSGTGISGGNDGWWPSMIVDGSGPIVGFESLANVLVRRWTGAWTGVGTAGSAPGLASAPSQSWIVSLARDGQGRPLASWTEGAATGYDIRAARFDGGAWTPLGGAVGNANTRYQAAFIVASGDAVFVSWIDDDAVTTALHVARFESGVWVTLPDPAAGSRPAMAIDGVGRPLLVWEQLDGLGHNIHGARWSGTLWESIDGDDGGISRSTLLAETPAIAVGSDGTVVVTWLQDTGGGVEEVYAKTIKLD